MRRAVLLGRFPDAVRTRLITEYGVRTILDDETLRPYMVPTLDAGQYDLVIVDERLPKAEQIADVTRQKDRTPIMVNPARGAQVVIDEVVAVTDWAIGGRTVFVVVTSTKGGVGKTTTAGALAALLADEGFNVLAVDDNPHQYNLVRFLTDDEVTITSAEDIKAGRVEPNVVDLAERIDLLAPDTYLESGVTLGAANGFWREVRKLSYDYVVVDTSPSIPTPNSPDDFVEVYLTYALLTGKHPAVYVVPFTPVEWGHKGLARTRQVLRNWDQMDWMLPVVTATDREHVLENVPDWLQKDGWQDRMVAVPYSRGIQTNPRITHLQDNGFFHNPTKPYRPLVQKVMLLAERRQERILKRNGGGKRARRLP
jgi:hypothetical protein